MRERERERERKRERKRERGGGGEREHVQFGGVSPTDYSVVSKNIIEFNQNHQDITIKNVFFLTLNLLPTLMRTSFLVLTPPTGFTASGNSFLIKGSLLTAMSCSRLA